MIEVLQFSANFCAPCHALSRQLRGKELTKININKTPEIAEKYNIRSAPVLLFLKDGIEVHRHKGMISVEDFDKILEKLIPIMDCFACSPLGARVNIVQ